MFRSLTYQVRNVYGCGSSLYIRSVDQPLYLGDGEDLYFLFPTLPGLSEDLSDPSSHLK